MLIETTGYCILTVQICTLISSSLVSYVSMNKNNPLEKHLLSRCYSTEAKVLEVLTTRYAVGNQKPHLILTPTSANPTDGPKALLHRDKKDNTVTPTILVGNRKVSTRLELKKYINDTLANQKRLLKKIQRHNNNNNNNNNKTQGSRKSFPIQKMLSHYEIPVFEEFAGLNDLWQKYMRNLLFPQSEKKKEDREDKVPSLTYLLPKLSSADYTGCLVTVIKARNSHLVGTRGIVVWDTQYLFIICVPRNEDSKEWTELATEKELTPSQQVGGLKIVPKKGCVFGFDVIIDEEEEDCIGFNIIGSRFEFRNVDRSSKKFKNHKVDDLF